MLILKTNNKTYEISKLLKGYRFKHVYIGYNLATAKKLFRHDYQQQQINEGKL
jgi:hypothetical protein